VISRASRDLRLPSFSWDGECRRSGDRLPTGLAAAVCPLPPSFVYAIFTELPQCPKMCETCGIPRLFFDKPDSRDRTAQLRKGSLSWLFSEGHKRSPVSNKDKANAMRSEAWGFGRSEDDFCQHLGKRYRCIPQARFWITSASPTVHRLIRKSFSYPLRIRVGGVTPLGRTPIARGDTASSSLSL